MTANMTAILDVLKEGHVQTPNQIGYAIGAVAHGPRGRSSRVPGPGSIIAGALTSLHRQGLIHMARRPDGMSGTAYGITDAGLAYLTRAV